MSAIAPSQGQPKPQRSSNIELLRIVAMLFIMFGHLSKEGGAGLPSADTLHSMPFLGGLWVWFRMMNLTGVDVFVLISGYFAIRPRVSSVVSFFYQAIFYSVGMYVVWLLTKQISFSFEELSIHLKPMRMYWFLSCYVWLLLLAPVLNRYAESATKREFALFLGSYYFFVCVVEWWMSASNELHMGFSVLAFVGLYLFARYIRLHGGCWCNLSAQYYLGIFFGVTLLSTLIALVLFWGMGRPLVDGDPWVRRLIMYISPLCIIASLSLLLFFSKLQLGYSRWVNWIAASSFSVYLLHEEYLTRERYVLLVKYIAQHYTVSVLVLLLVAFVLGLYFMTTLVDQLRQVLRKKVFSPLVVYLEEYAVRRIKL